jgi:hypothetical protein
MGKHVSISKTSLSVDVPKRLMTAIVQTDKGLMQVPIVESDQLVWTNAILIVPRDEKAVTLLVEEDKIILVHDTEADTQVVVCLPHKQEPMSRTIRSKKAGVTETGLSYRKPQ